MCFNMHIDVCAHACVYVHFCNIPPQVLKLASLASPPPNIENLPTHKSQAAILGSPFETQNYFTFIPQSAGPRSAVGNVSGYRCVSDCRSRGCELDPGPVPYFRGD